MNKKSIEVDNTDAEGRLILADALCYASQFEPNVIIDVATLTGAVVVALGNEVSGCFSTSNELWRLLELSGHLTNDKLWRLPFFDNYLKLMKSNVADLLNSGGIFYI
jgi:leucyl aminopeptidase